jgi:hypothetical protein
MESKSIEARVAAALDEGYSVWLWGARPGTGKSALAEKLRLSVAPKVTTRVPRIGVKRETFSDILVMDGLDTFDAKGMKDTDTVMRKRYGVDLPFAGCRFICTSNFDLPDPVRRGFAALGVAFKTFEFA